LLITRLRIGCGIELLLLPLLFQPQVLTGSSSEACKTGNEKCPSPRNSAREEKQDCQRGHDKSDAGEKRTYGPFNARRSFLFVPVPSPVPAASRMHPDR